MKFCFLQTVDHVLMFQYIIYCSVLNPYSAKIDCEVKLPKR